MIRLPRCPHCGMYFRYRQVLSGRILGKKSCPHCHKPFRAALGRVTGLMILLLLAVCVGVNLLMLRVMNANGVAVFFLSFLFTLVFFLCLPLSIHYKDEKGNAYTTELRPMIGQARARRENPEIPKRKRSKSERIRIRKEEAKKEQEKR